MNKGKVTEKPKNLNARDLKKAANLIIAAKISHQAYTNLRQWWRGEISDKECAKNMIGIFGSTFGSIAGRRLGSAIGKTLLGSGAGEFIGEFVGEWVGVTLGNNASQFTSEWFFSLSKNDALAQAYKFLGVSSTATNAEITAAYRRLDLKYHPDKGGSYGQWNDLGIAVEMVKLARGQQY